MDSRVLQENITRLVISGARWERDTPPMGQPIPMSLPLITGATRDPGWKLPLQLSLPEQPVLFSICVVQRVRLSRGLLPTLRGPCAGHCQKHRQYHPLPA